MPKKGQKLTEEQKEQLRERMAKARAAKVKKQEQAANEVDEISENIEAASVEPTPPANTGELGVEQLTKMVLELQNALIKQQNTGGGNQSSAQVANGRIVGISDKYPTGKDNYEDPRERLYKEPRLKRIAFQENYELEYEVTTVTYETKSGVTERQPKFTVELNQIILDDDGEPTNRRIGRARMIFFEDPDTAMKIAADNNLEVDETNQMKFLNDMRYLRVRDWVFECFWPNKVQKKVEGEKEIVVNGQIVRTWEVSAPEGEQVNIDYSNSRFRV